MTDRYEILEPFGESPLGPLYKARDRELERLVLLRHLPPGLFRDDGERRHCLRRAAAVASLHHPCLPTLYEAGETGEGDLFQACAWTEGEMLARRLATGPLKPAVAIDLTAQVAGGLAVAHAQGIVHGRLDPSSLLVTSSGEAKLLDLAAASLGERTWSGAGSPIDTAWLAPEQRKGGAAGARSDVWALGAMLYEMITGRRLQHSAPEPLRALQPEAPEELEHLLAKALEPEPARRLASAEVLWLSLGSLARSGSRPLETGPAQPVLPQAGTETGGRVGHYRLLELLGGGGMGVVYRAEDTRLGRTAALKLLPPEMVRDPVAKVRFFQEARTASALEHPNLCTIYDAAEAADGRLWLAMPCYDGETLRSRLERGPLPIEEAVDVARQIALGLAKAHRQGIVHRDIKPANLMLTSDGVVKILDFGIAKLAGGAGITRAGMAIGTPGYMAPEQALGAEVDHRTDLWSLGVVLYEMLAGRRPFPGDQSAAVIDGILHREPEPLARKRPEVPPKLEEIVRRLLVKDPGGRYGTAEEVTADLRALAGPSSVTIPLRPPRPAGRSRALWAGAALTLGLLAAGGWWLGPWRERAGPSPPTFDRLTDQEGIELFPSLSPAGDFFVYAKKEGGDLDLFLQRVGGKQPINLTPDSPAEDTHPAFSPDGSQIVFRSERAGGGLFLMGATGESVRRLTNFGHNPTWSPDGRQIACATEPIRDPSSRQRRSQLWRIDIATGQRRLVAEQDAVQPSWSPDGQRIAYWGLAPGTSRRQIWTVPAEGGSPVLVIDDGRIDWNPVWAPDGRFLYFVSDRSGSMNLWRVAIDPETGERGGDPEPVTIPANWSGFPSFSRDGQRLLYATHEQRTTLERVALDPGGPRVIGDPVLLTRGVHEFFFASVSPDGAWIVLSSWGLREDLFVVRPDGSGFRQITDDPARDRAPVWLPDGRILFSSDRSGRYEAWSIDPDGSGLRQLTATRGQSVIHPISSPDGLRLAFGRGHTGASWVDLSLPLEQRTPRRFPLLPAGASLFPHSWARDGKRLLAYSNLGILLFTFPAGQYEKLTPAGELPIWMQDQRRILWLDGEGAIRVLDTRTRESRQILAPLPGSVCRALDLSPDNRWLYVLRTMEEGDLWARESNLH